MKTTMGMGFDLLDVLDKEVTGLSVGDDNAEDRLITLYVDLWTALKQRAGTSSGFGGIGEYLFFRYILNYLERSYGSKLAVERCTTDTCIFKSDSILLTHDVYVSSYDSTCPKQKVDIAIFARIQDRWQIAAAFEIKTSVPSRADIEKLLGRLEILLANTSALVFPIPFNAGDRITAMYKKELDDFCARSHGRAHCHLKTPI